MASPTQKKRTAQSAARISGLSEGSTSSTIAFGSWMISVPPPSSIAMRAQSSTCTISSSEGVIRPGCGEVVGGGSGNGIDVSRFADDVIPTRAEARERFGLPAEATVVGFVGRLTRDKGIADLTNAFTSTLRQRPDVRAAEYQVGAAAARVAQADAQRAERGAHALRLVVRAGALFRAQQRVVAGVLLQDFALAGGLRSNPHRGLVAAVDGFRQRHTRPLASA